LFDRVSEYAEKLADAVAADWLFTTVITYAYLTAYVVFAVVAFITLLKWAIMLPVSLLRREYVKPIWEFLGDLATLAYWPAGVTIGFWVAEWCKDVWISAVLPLVGHVVRVSGSKGAQSVFILTNLAAAIMFVLLVAGIIFRFSQLVAHELRSSLTKHVPGELQRAGGIR